MVLKTLYETKYVSQENWNMQIKYLFIILYLFIDFIFFIIIVLKIIKRVRIMFHM